MAILNAQQAVNTRDLPELKNVVNGNFGAGADPEGGPTFFNLPSFVGFQYRGPDALFGTADDIHVEVVSTAGGTGDIDAAAQIIYKGTISSLFVKRGTVDLYEISGFAPFDITDLYDDATNGLTNFPSLLFASDDTLNGSAFDDILFGFAGADVINGNNGNDEMDGGAGNDGMDGGAGNDQMDGGDGDDVMTGGAGNDEMNGGDGADQLTAGLGADSQTGGGGGDTFFFLSILESTKKASGRDTILDFNRAEGDEIHLTAIDAKKGKGNQDFTFIKKQDFHDKKGELRYKVKNGDAYVEGDTDGNGKADFVIVVADVTKLKGGDFEL